MAIDAVVVPTQSAPSILLSATHLSLELGARLVVMCNDREHARTVSTFLSRIPAPHAAIGIPRRLPFDLKLGQHALADRQRDVSIRRNLALALGRTQRWRRMLFLDDDVRLSSRHVARAVSLVKKHRVVGFPVQDFPDGSVNAHALRVLGMAWKPPRNASGGALLVDPCRTTAHFPLGLYNEDMLFLLEEKKMGQVAITGSARQEEYDPFKSPTRASREAVGGAVADLLYWAWDCRLDPLTFPPQTWAWALRERIRIADALIQETRAPSQEAGRRLSLQERQAIERSLRAGRSRLKRLNPRELVTLVQTLDRDRARWIRFLGEMDRGGRLSLGGGFSALGLDRVAFSLEH